MGVATVVLWVWPQLSQLEKELEEQWRSRAERQVSAVEDRWRRKMEETREEQQRLQEQLKEANAKVHVPVHMCIIICVCVHWILETLREGGREKERGRG